METEKNIISSEAKLSAIAAVMFFSPFVKNRVKSDSSFSDEERDFIAWYVQIWFVNLVFLIFVLAASITNVFVVNWILSWVTMVWSIAIFIISVFSLFACANDLSMWEKNESIMQNIQHKWQLVKAYIPVVNFVLWFRQENYNIPYRWLKESILLWTFFVFWTLILWNSFGMWILIIIAVRLILLLLNIDIVPISMKKAINRMFLCNPWEIMSYFSAFVVSKIKKVDYNMVLQARKQWYSQWQKFGFWIIFQYVLFLGLLFLLYRWIDISRDNTILFIAWILWIIRVILFCVYKKSILRIPLLSEMVSLVFH